MSEQQPPAASSMTKNVVIAVLGTLVVVLAVLLIVQHLAWRDLLAQQNLTTDPQTSETVSSPETPSEEQSDAAPRAETPAPEPNPEFEAFLLSLPTRDADDYQARGELEAPVVIVEWADFSCGYCHRFALQTMPELEHYIAEGHVRLEYRPVAILGEASTQAAVAAHAAGQQGKFWPFHDAVVAAVAQGQAVSDALLLDIAAQVGVPDLNQFEAALSSPDLVEQVRADTAAAQEIGISSTPTFVVGAEVIQGAQP